MAQCPAKVKNKICNKPVARGQKYCADHLDFEKKITSKADSGFGQGDTKDRTGKSQAHNMQPKGGSNSRVGH